MKVFTVIGAFVVGLGIALGLWLLYLWWKERQAQQELYLTEEEDTQ